MRITLNVVGVLVLLGVPSTETLAQRIAIPLARLESPVHTTRMRAFHEMVVEASGGPSNQSPQAGHLAARARQQEDLSLALIALLERENAIIQAAPVGSLSEDHTASYYPELFVTVARLGDRRALKALMVVIHNGEPVLSAIVALGEEAIPDLLRAVRTPDPLRQPSAARGLGQIAARRTDFGISDSGMVAIRAALLRAVKDPDNFILRLKATEALGAFTDAEVRAEMERLATSDTYSSQRGAKRVFPVRQAARAWLDHVR